MNNFVQWLLEVMLFNVSAPFQIGPMIMSRVRLSTMPVQRQRQWGAFPEPVRFSYYFPVWRL